MIVVALTDKQELMLKKLAKLPLLESKLQDGEGQSVRALTRHGYVSSITIRSTGEKKYFLTDAGRYMFKTFFS